MSWKRLLGAMLPLFVAYALVGCGNSKKTEEGRAQLVQRIDEQLQAAKAKADAYDFDRANAILRDLPEDVNKSPFADVETYDKLTADIEAIRRRVFQQETDYRKRIRAGWKLIDGRFVSRAEQQRALAEEKRRQKEEANRKEEERRMAQARARAEAEAQARAKAKAEAQARAKAKAEAQARAKAEAEARARDRARAARAKAKTEKGMGETLSVGYTSYCMWRAWYSDRLSSNQFLNKRPNAKWLFLDISVRNNDTKARMVPPFKLVDENGAEYESSAEGTMIENAIGVLETLNPSVTKQGLVVFDVPQNHQYRLKVSGGYWSAEEGFIRIDPGSPP